MTYRKDTNSIKNQIYPDIDRSKGVPVPMVTTRERRKNTENKRYKTFKQKQQKPTIIKAQSEKRKKWLSVKEYW